MKRRWVAWLAAFVALLVVAGSAFVIWSLMRNLPMPEAMAALEADAEVTVVTESWLVFAPAGTTPSTGLVLYPGGLVNPVAYAPVARAIAAEGFRVVVVPMPLNLAVVAPDRAAEVIRAFPEVRTWAVGGHSLGGAMAARYADRRPEQVKGLVLWAAYPAGGNDLSQRSLAVVSIYGSRDGLATADDIDASRALLPATTTWVEIDGGNHAQFGWYGAQARDLEATISRESQQAQVVAATVGLLEGLGEGD
jgi:pimeloyl-ACP methyl ester carboxylesterase